MQKPKFNWGHSSNASKKLLTQEIFESKIYETQYPVQKGDVVLDLGASTGPFTWSVMDKASKVIAVEPSRELIPLIEQNTVGYPVTIISKGLVKYNVWNGEGENDSNVITFHQIIKENNLDKINFIKTDCEGGEYALFTEQNMPFLLNNVRNIVGEFHLSNPIEKVEFRYFRDKYLKQFPKFEVYSVDGINIKWDLWNDHFIEYYNQVIIHINNE